MVGGSGILVNVPRPGRFAWHKLIVAARRSTKGASAAKAPKDRAQAAALLGLLLDEIPGEITLAWKALQARGATWVGAVARSLRLLPADLVEQLKQLGVGPR